MTDLLDWDFINPELIQIPRNHRLQISKIAIVSKLDIDKMEESIQEAKDVSLTLDRKFKRDEIGAFKKDTRAIVF